MQKYFFHLLSPLYNLFIDFFQHNMIYIKDKLKGETMGFDALKYVETLRKAGIPDRQAEAQVRVLNEIIDSNLATKRDIKELEQKIVMMEQRIVIKLGSLLTAGLVALVALSKLNLI